MFLGATLTATSVGITARVFRDLGKVESREARIVLGAAVIDDVLGLIVLAVVAGIIGAAAGGGGVTAAGVAWIVAKAVGFLVVALAAGLLLAPRVFALAARLRVRGVLLATSLSVCFLLSYFSGIIGLAPIVGAFAAGLILESVPFEKFESEPSLEALLHPVSSFLVPLFFVHMGLLVDLRAFVAPGVPLVAGALIVCAIVGKLVSPLGAVGRGLDRVSIGIGMIPRGEVGLIFANLGLTMCVGGRPIVDARTFSAIVAMVVTTTIITPPALHWSFRRGDRRASSG
jgi:Kef-type K+ transport system membrane component KefB